MPRTSSCRLILQRFKCLNWQEAEHLTLEAPGDPEPDAWPGAGGVATPPGHYFGSELSTGRPLLIEKWALDGLWMTRGRQTPFFWLYRPILSYPQFYDTKRSENRKLFVIQPAENLTRCKTFYGHTHFFHLVLLCFTAEIFCFFMSWCPRLCWLCDSCVYTKLPLENLKTSEFWNQWAPRLWIRIVGL